MVNNISAKVLKSERSLARKSETLPPSQTESPSLPKIRVISTFGGDEELVAITRKYEPHLSRTRSFSESDASQPRTASPDNHPNSKRLLQYVKKTGASLRSRLVKVKHLALGAQHGPTKKCNKGTCKCCDLISGEHEYRVNGKRVKASPGNCASYNVIYLVQCSLCQKAYVGRTTRVLRKRIGEHRTKYYELLRGKSADNATDDHSLGVHLLEHNADHKDDFNKIFNVSIIDNASPRTLEVRENNFIHLLKTLRPLGINTVNPFGLPLLHASN